VELEEQHYSPAHAKLLNLGLQPHYLSEELLKGMLARIENAKHRIKHEIILPRIKWDGDTRQTEKLEMMWAGA
jgi:UDP-sulfoquinovose synthase